MAGRASAATRPSPGDDTAAPFSRDYAIVGTSTTQGAFQAALTNRVGLAANSSTFNLVKDSGAPSVTISVPGQSGLLVPVRWQGTDTGSAGIATYTVQVKVGAGSWTDWLVATPATGAEYMGTAGESYAFRVQAKDRVGNASPWVETSSVLVQAVTKYYHFGGKLVAMRRGSGTTGPLTYLSGDHLGSVSLARTGQPSTTVKHMQIPDDPLNGIISRTVNTVTASCPCQFA